METIRVIKVKEDYIIEGLKDYGFKYDSDKRTYKKSGLEVDERTKTLECVDKCDSKDLSVILELEKYGIIYINETIKNNVEIKAFEDKTNISSKEDKTTSRKAKKVVKNGN